MKKIYYKKKMQFLEKSYNNLKFKMKDWLVI